MLNQFVLVGKITRYKEIDEKHAKLKIMVDKNLQNEPGLSENNIIPIELTGSIMTNVEQYCQKGNIVGVKGKIINKNNLLVLRAEKVSFLSSRKKEGK